jgi:tetratricopeptide (TPR) repeat protein
MTPEQFRRLEELYDAAMAMPAADRARFANEQCGGDDDLRRELLAALDDTASGLTDVVQSAVSAAVESEADWAGRRLGPYRIVRPLGRGGMGAVFLAVRDDDQFHKDVAIKTLKFELAGDQAVARFRRERQILAHLEHPNIARLLDGGATDRGTPYIVLEYIAGVEIAAWCEQQQLSIEQRLRVFLQVCDAVQYAHQHLVVHRDLKPANILVTADGVPKLLDFGIAKLLESGGLDAFEGAMATSALFMTPDYVSPEQVRGEPVSTVTDVYSLGAVLFQLLTGERPRQLLNYDAVEIARVVCDTEMRPPSALGNRRLRGDLDTIVLKAMHKDPARRYSSVAGFAEDIHRHLGGLPIDARPDAPFYRTAKFLRRHRVGVAATAAVVVSLVVGAAVATREAIQARRADNTAQAVNDFLRNDLLAQASAATQSGPSAKPDPNLTVRTALDRAATKIEDRFSRQPEVEAAIHNTIGETYADLGAYSEARTHLTRALELDRRLLGDSDRVTLRAMNRVARVAYLQGRYPDAEKGFKEAVDAQRRVLGPDHPDTLSSMNDLAIIYNVTARYPEAAALDNQILDIRRRALGPEHPDTLTTMHNLAIVYRHQARFADAETLHKQALEARRRVLGPEHPFTVSSINNLALVYLDQNRSAEAVPLFEEAMDIRRRVLGADHPDTLGTVSSLAIIEVGLGRYEKASALFKQGLESWRRQFGDVDPSTPQWMQGVAYTAALLGRRAESEALFRQAVDMCSRVQGTDHPATLDMLNDIAFLYQREGRYALAETYGADVLARRRRVLGAEHPDTIVSMTNAAMTYVSEGKFVLSEALAREAWAVSRKVQPDSWEGFYAESLLGESLAGMKRYAEAEPLLLEGYNGMSHRKDQIIAPAWFAVDRVGDWIPQLYDAWGKPERAGAWRQAAPRTPGVESAAHQLSSH